MEVTDSGGEQAIKAEKNRLANLKIWFPGFEFHRVLSRTAARPNYQPQLNKRTVLSEKLRDVFRRLANQPVRAVKEVINPTLLG